MENNECSICYEIFMYNNVKIGCGHTFHYKCIGKWFIESKNNMCPICRGKNNYNEELDKVIDVILVKLAITKHNISTNMELVISLLSSYSIYYPDKQKGNLLYLALTDKTKFIENRIAKRVSSLVERKYLKLSIDGLRYEHIT